MKLELIEDEQLKVVKFFYARPGFSYYCPQGSFGDAFPGMVRYYSVAVGGGIKPDFMASFGVPVKDKAGFAQFADSLVRFKGRKMAHFSNRTGICVSNFSGAAFLENNSSGTGSLCSMRDSIIRRATSSAISNVSAMVRPWAIRPCRTELVAKYPPSSKCSIDTGIKYSDILSPPIKMYHRDTILSRPFKLIYFEACLGGRENAD
jgi:hypothetical protein